MPEKIGNGGYGQENYDPNTEKYVADGTPNKSYKNPEEEKAMEMFGLSSGESVEDVDDWEQEEISNVNIDESNLESVKIDLNNNGYETEENSPTFDEIYKDYVREVGVEPQTANDIIEFVREKVVTSGKLIYKVKKRYV